MIQSLKRLWKALRRSTPDEAGSATITPNEQVARFIYDKTAWSRQQATPKPKPKVFYPMKEAGQWETSVCRIHSASEERIWKIANSARSPLLALGRADLSVYSIQNVGLQTCPAPDLETDYPEHAVIVGWPDEKDKQMELAVQLALTASLVLVSKTVSTC